MAIEGNALISMFVKDILNILNILKSPLRRIPRERWQSREPSWQHYGCPEGFAPAKYPSSDVKFSSQRLDNGHFLCLLVIDTIQFTHEFNHMSFRKRDFFTTNALKSDELFHPLYLDRDKGNKTFARLSHIHSLETCQDRHRPIHQPDQSTSLHFYNFNKHHWNPYILYCHHLKPTPGHTWAISVATTPWCSGSGLPYHCWRDLGGDVNGS